MKKKIIARANLEKKYNEGNGKARGRRNRDDDSELARHHAQHMGSRRGIFSGGLQAVAARAGGLLAEQDPSSLP